MLHSLGQPMARHSVECSCQLGFPLPWCVQSFPRKNALTRRHKLRVWQACVYTSTVYGLDACGLTPMGAKRLTAQIVRQVRLIVWDPVYMTGNSNHKVLDAWGMTPPVEALRRQLLKETEDASPDIFRRGPGSAAWHRVLSTLVETLSTQIIEVRNSSDLGVPCPDCGIYFTNRASMLGHMSKKHADHKARPVNQTHGVFDKHEDALGGLPQCKHCKVKLCDFSSLCKHINEHRCRVLFPSRPYAPQTVGGQAWIS